MQGGTGLGFLSYNPVLNSTSDQYKSSVSLLFPPSPSQCLKSDDSAWVSAAISTPGLNVQGWEVLLPFSSHTDS